MSKDTTPPDFVEKTFANSQKNEKFTKRFSLESFLPYVNFLYYDTHELHTLTPLLPPHLELVMQCLNVVFHTLDELGLVLSDGSTDVSPHKESIVA